MAKHMSLADQVAELINPAPLPQAPEDDLVTAARVVDKFEDDEFDVESIGKSNLRIRNATLLDTDNRYSGRPISAKQLRDEENELSFENDENEEIESEENIIENSEKWENSDENDPESDENVLESDENDTENDESDENVTENEEKMQNEISENFSRLDFTSEIEKGVATRSQLIIFDSLLECRIQFQKVLQLSNQLPQHDIWHEFMKNPELNKIQKESYRKLKKLMDKLIELQTKLFIKYPETKKILQIQNETDEEIDNSEDDETEKPIERKRKLNFNEYPEFLAKRHADFNQFRDSTITKWNEKTKLATGKLKSFNAFDQTALKQIEQILSDKNRLLTRCRTKRSVYKILGKTVKDEPNGIDVEIFDDDDFYQQLLRELIEKQGKRIDDPTVLSDHWAKIQKLRGKMKKKVDTKASKGRRIRYKIHTKLVNFMAPYDNSISDSRNELFNSLFGKKTQNVDVNTNFLFGSLN